MDSWLPTRCQSKQAAKKNCAPLSNWSPQHRGKDKQEVQNGADPVAPQACPCPEQASARSCGAKNLAARSRVRLPRRFALDGQVVPVEGRRGVSQVVPPPYAHVYYFHVQLQPFGLDAFAPLLRTPAEKLRLELPTRELAQSWRRRWSWCRGCWRPARMLRDVPDEAMPELFDVRKCHIV